MKGMHAERERASRIIVADSHPDTHVEQPKEAVHIDDHASLLTLDGKEMETKYGHDAPITTV